MKAAFFFTALAFWSSVRSQDVQKKPEQLKVIGENITTEGGLNAEDINGALLDTLFRKWQGGNLVYNAPGITLADIDKRSFSFEKKIEKYLGKVDFKKKWHLGSPDSFWRNLKRGRTNLVREPFVDDFFYNRDSLFDANKIGSKAIWCFYNPVFVKVMNPDKTEKHFAILVVSSINDRYKCDPFGGIGYRIDLFEKKNNVWQFTENLAWAFDN